ncbi:MAG: peptidyl-prolyl cis-trans isomerase [Flavobacteriaceae bacterium]
MFGSFNKIYSRTAVFAVLLLLAQSCNFFINDADRSKPLARVGENYLYRADVLPLLHDGISKEDSTTFVNHFITNWAAKQLLLTKAKINLTEEKLAEFDRLVNDYRNDLYTRAYKDALVMQGNDTVVTKSQMREFYEREKNNFRLKERLVKLRFIELPKQFLDKETVIKKLKGFNEDDVAYLDSIGVQFRKLNFNDSLWIPTSRVIDEIPPLTIENQDKYLKNSQFFELEDSLGVYLAKVTGVLERNEVAPLSYIEPTIEQVLMNRRRLDYIRRLEMEIIDEAIKDNEFEVYAQDE